LIKQEAIGQTLRGEQVFLISQSSITDFAKAIGQSQTELAPPTYAFTIIIKAFESTLKDSGMNWDRMVHGDQKFEIIQSIQAGDRLRVDTTIESVRLVAGNELVSVRADIYRDVDTDSNTNFKTNSDSDQKEALIRAWSTLVVRGS
jgi:hypothetical protein